MRSKKSRHKLVALNFLSNISLDGKHESKPNGVDYHSSAPCICSDGKNVKTFEDNPVYGQQTSDTYYETVETLVPVKVLREPEASSNSAAHTQIHTSYNSCVNTSKAETCSNYYIPNVACSDASYVNSNVKRLENVTDQLSADKALASTDSVSPLFGAVPKTYIRVKLSRESTGSHYSHGLEDVKLLGKVNPKLSQSTSCPMFSKRIGLRSVGAGGTTFALFSVLPYHRKTTGTNFRVGRRQFLPNNSQKVLSGVEQFHTPSNSVRLPQTFIFPGVTHARESTAHCNHHMGANLSSFRPVNGEVISYAHLIQSNSTMLKNSLKPIQPTSTSLTSYPMDSESLSHIISNADLKSNYESTTHTSEGAVTRRGHSNNPSTVSSNTACWHRPTKSFSRQRNTSSSSTSRNSLVNIVSLWPSTTLSYPDPLISYNPFLLDDPELLVATGKRVLKLPNYLTSILGYVRPNERKREVNREFHERFPLIQITLTKLRSIKLVLVQIVQKLSLDLWVCAHAHVLFEKLILKLFITKLNRKLCASASLMISAKLNDVKGSDFTSLLQELETAFRISRRDLINTELDVALGLEFSLIPPESEILPHYQRICKSLDLTLPLIFPPVFTSNNGINTSSSVRLNATAAVNQHHNGNSTTINIKNTDDSDSITSDHLTFIASPQVNSAHSFIDPFHRCSPIQI